MGENGHVLEAVLRFLREELLFGTPVVLTPETRILDEGLLNSTGFLEIVGFLEGEFSLRLLDGELVPENFATPIRVAELVARHLSDAPAVMGVSGTD